MFFGDGAARLRAISRSQAVIEFTPDGRILTANQNFLDAVGYSLAEIRGKHHSLFLPAADRDTAEYRGFWKALAAGEFVAGEFRREAKGGREISLQASWRRSAARRR